MRSGRFWGAKIMKRNQTSSGPPGDVTPCADDRVCEARTDAVTSVFEVAPLALCTVALAIWIGAAVAGAGKWSTISFAETARELVRPLAVGALCLSGITVVAMFRFGTAVGVVLRGSERRLHSDCAHDGQTSRTRVHHTRREIGGLPVAIVPVVLAAMLAGGAMRYAQTVREASLPTLELRGEHAELKREHVSRATAQDSSIESQHDPRQETEVQSVAQSEDMLVTVEATVRTAFQQRPFAVDILAKHLEKPARFQCLVDDVVFIADDGTRMALNDFGGGVLSISILDRPPCFGVTDRVRIVGRLRSVMAAVNPSNLDPREYAARKGIVGSLSVDSPELCLAVEDYRTANPLADALCRVRENVRSRLRESLLIGVPEDRAGAVRPMLVALVLGDVEDGYAPIENAFRSVGLAHILAISGFNLAVLGWVVALITSFFVTSPRLRAIPVALAALCALFIMAPAASATRSALMAIVGATGAASGRDWHGNSMMAIAAIVMLVAEPSVATNAGFQLSFACVIALRHLAPTVRFRWFAWMPTDEVWRGFKPLTGILGEFASRAFAAAIATFLVSTPIALSHFGTMQPLGVLLTLACAPLSTATLVIAYPKAIIGAVWPMLVAPIGPVLWVPTWLQIALVECSLTIFGGAWAIGETPVWTAIALLVVTTVIFFAPQWKVRWAGWIFLAGIVIQSCVLVRDTGDRPHFAALMFSVGDGSLHAIESGPSTVIFDAGSSSSGSVGSRIAIPWVMSRGGSIDTIFMSHPDLDHFSAVADLVRYAYVGRIVVHPSFVAAKHTTPAVRELLDIASEHGVEVHTTVAGDTFRIGNATWNVLWPPGDFHSRRDNDLSLVIRIDVDPAPNSDIGARVLFTGDIETIPAARLIAAVEQRKIDVNVDVFELPHHGSWREAVVPLLVFASPQVVLQSTARRRFEMDRFKAHISPLSTRLVTCRDGATKFEVAGEELLSWIYDRDFAGGWRPAGRRKL